MVPIAPRRPVRAAGLLLLIAACGLPEEPITTLEDPRYEALPNLRRASLELQERIRREQEHVDALELELLAKRSEEASLHDRYLAAEADYALRSADLTGVLQDLRDVEQELADTRAALQAARTELAGLQAELGAVQAEVGATRAAAPDAPASGGAEAADDG